MKVNDEFYKFKLRKMILNVIRRKDLLEKNVISNLFINVNKKHFIVSSYNIIYLHYFLENEFKLRKIKGISLVGSGYLIRSIGDYGHIGNQDFFIKIKISNFKKFCKENRS